MQLWAKTAEAKDQLERNGNCAKFGEGEVQGLTGDSRGMTEEGVAVAERELPSTGGGGRLAIGGKDDDGAAVDFDEAAGLIGY